MSLCCETEQSSIQQSTVMQWGGIHTHRDMDYDSNDDEAARVSLKGELRIQAADACAEFISECNLPRRHTVGGMGYEVTSHAVHSSIPNELKNQIFDIFEVNMREYYEQNWGWDKEMKW